AIEDAARGAEGRGTAVDRQGGVAPNQEEGAFRDPPAEASGPGPRHPPQGQRGRTRPRGPGADGPPSRQGSEREVVRPVTRPSTTEGPPPVGGGRAGGSALRLPRVARWMGLVARPPAAVSATIATTPTLTGLREGGAC